MFRLTRLEKKTLKKSNVLRREQDLENEGIWILLKMPIYLWDLKEQKNVSVFVDIYKQKVSSA